MINRSPIGTFCDQCKMEFGHYDQHLSTWSFRAKRKGEAAIDAQSYLTVTSEMFKSNGAVRHYCRFHLTESSRWPDGKGGEIIWPITEQLAYAKQLEMAASDV